VYEEVRLDDISDDLVALGVGFIFEAVSLFVSIGIGACVYGILVTILKIEEINLITDMIKKRFIKKS